MRSPIVNYVFCMAKRGVRKLSKIDMVLAGVENLRTALEGARTELKADVGSLRTELKADVGSLKDDLEGLRVELEAVKDNIKTNMYTKKEHDKFVESLIEYLDYERQNMMSYIDENLVSKKEFNKLLNDIDEMMGEVRESRDMREIYGHRFAIANDQLANHEKRIKVLEMK